MLEGIDTAGLDLQALDEADFADLSYFAESPEHAAPRKRRQADARAIRTRNRIETRRAKCEALLHELLPELIEDGDSWHVVSGGDVDSLSFLQHLMRGEPWEYGLISTWCMAMQDVEQLAAWLNAGRLWFLDVYTGEILPSQYPAVHEAICATVRAHQGRVATFRNHSKVALLANGQTARYAVVESSANMNTNPRTEQTVVTLDRALFSFYADFFAGIRSFNDNFPAWKQWSPAPKAVQ